MLKYIFVIFYGFFSNANTLQNEYQSLPSVGKLYSGDTNKSIQIANECVANEVSLQGLLNDDNIKNYVKKNFDASSKCEDVIMNLKKMKTITNEIDNLAKNPICNVESIDPNTITTPIAIERKDMIESRFNTAMEDYTKYFTYTQKISHIERCLDFYNQVTTVDDINQGVNALYDDISNKQSIVQKYGLQKIYGDRGSVITLGISDMIADINSGNISMFDAKKYGIVESNTNLWKINSITENYVIYYSGEHYIAVSFKEGITYSYNQLFHNIFALEKKIEFPEYSVFILKPLY